MFHTQLSRGTRDAFRASLLAAATVAISVYAASAAEPANGPLQYRWKAGLTAGYEIDITVDTPEDVETYKGSISYAGADPVGGLLKVTYSGGVVESKKPKQTQSSGGFPIGPPRHFGPFGPGGPFSQPTFMGLRTTTNTLTMTPTGQFRSLEGTSQLPWLLGHLCLLVFERLPEGNQQTWTVDGGATMTEGGGERQGPPFGPPFGPFGRGNKPEKETAGSETTTYRLEQSAGGLVVINKKYSLKFPDPKASFEVNGEGKWTFNRDLGVPEKLDYQQKLVLTKDNVTATMPMTIKFRRFSDVEWKKLQEENRQKAEKLAREAAEAKAVADAKAAVDALVPLTADEKRTILADIKSGDYWRTKGALEKLAAKTPKKSDKELVDAIYPNAKHDNVFIRGAAQAALKKWAPDLERKAKLNETFMGPHNVEPSDRPVTNATPLPVGLILCYRDFSGWHPVEVREVLPDGKVKVQYRGWGQRQDNVSRADLRLAPDEVDQPALDATALAQLKGDSGTKPAGDPEGADGYRMWTDDSGTFKVEAQYQGVTDGKVQLRRKDGREVKVPLARLSKPDQAEVQKLQQKPKVSNPFE